MEIFEFNKKVLALFGLFPQQNNNARTNFRLIGFFVFIVFNSVYPSYCIIKYILEHFGEFSEYNLAVCLLICEFTSNFSAATFIYEYRKIQKIIVDLQAIVDKRKRDNCAFHIYENAKKIAVIISYYCPIIFIPVALGYYMIVALFSAIYFYVRDGYLDPSKWYHILQFSTPFDENTFGGYFGYAIYCLYLGAVFIFLQLTVLSFFVGSCLFLRATCFDLKTIFDEMDNLSETKSNKNRLKFKMLLAYVVEFHIKMKEIFGNLADLISGTIFCQLLGAILIVATLLFEVDAKIGHPDLNLLFVMLIVPLNLSNVYVYCYVGTMMTAHFEELADVVYQSKWYQYDLQIRKCLTLLIANYQQPLVFTGFKLVYLSMVTFSRLMNSAVSYYLMFKRFTEAVY